MILTASISKGSSATCIWYFAEINVTMQHSGESYLISSDDQNVIIMENMFLRWVLKKLSGLFIYRLLYLFFFSENIEARFVTENIEKSSKILVTYFSSKTQAVQVSFKNKVSKLFVEQQFITEEEVTDVYFEPLNMAPIANWSTNFTGVARNVSLQKMKMKNFHRIKCIIIIRLG